MASNFDILLQKRRDKATARRFFTRVMRSCPTPRKIVIDQLRSYSAAKAGIPELASVKHVFVKAAARVNNRAENSHQPTRERERRMRGFRDPKRTQEFLSCFGPIRQHFALKRHLLRASLYRKQLAARFTITTPAAFPSHARQVDNTRQTGQRTRADPRQSPQRVAAPGMRFPGPTTRVRGPRK
jgi:putative transposase